MTELNGNQPEQPAMGQEAMPEIPVEQQQAGVQKQPRYDVKIVDEFVLKYAGFWTRFWAYLIDLVVLGSICRLLVYPLFRLAGGDLASNIWYAPIALITAVIYYAYFILMTKYFGQTVGKMILGIKVVPLKSEKLNWSTIIFRELVGRFFSKALPLLIVLYSIVAFTPKKQGLHDFVADTTVVHEGTYLKSAKKVFRKRESLSELQEPNAF